MPDFDPANLVNGVSGFATIFAGLTCLALNRWVSPQPRRWLAVYWAIVLTGIPTVWYHGFGEQRLPGLADISTNLLLAWTMQVAALWDGYPIRTRRRVAGISGLVNLAVIAWRLLGFQRSLAIPLGEFGGFTLSEVTLIADSFLAVGLLYGRYRQLPRRSQPMLRLVTAVFLVGMALASASNSQIHLTIIAYHALWHLVGAFGFVLLWGFNHLRFTAGEYS